MVASVPEESELPRHRTIWLLVAVGVVVMIAVGAFLIHGSDGDVSANAQPQREYAAGWVCMASADVCGRLAKDMGRRESLPLAQLRQVQDAEKSVQRIVLESASSDRPTPTCEADGVSCHLPRNPPVASNDAQILVANLSRAGIQNAVVRIAGPNDPAPAGTLLYGIPAGPGCLVGFLDGLNGGGGFNPVGRLPSGACLDPAH
jgi:hypothetical protein